VSLASGGSRVEGAFRTVTSEPDVKTEEFSFGERLGVTSGTLIESEVVLVPGFNMPVALKCGPHADYRIDGGEWTSEDGMLLPDQTLQTRHESKKGAEAVMHTFVRVGHKTGHFFSRTEPKAE
jgi:hypothetical protein